MLELLLEILLALDVEMVGRLVQQVHVGPQQLHLEEHQPRAFAVAQHADRLIDLGERKTGRREITDGVFVADARRLRDVIEDRRVERQVAHRLIEIDQPAGRVEAHRREAVVVLELRIEGAGQRRQER